MALKAHGDQAHGSLKIGDHLQNVVDHVNKHYDSKVNVSDREEVLAAAWLHDVLEDTNVTFEQVEDQFGFDVACMVEALTDKQGKNRMERHLKTYHAIRRNPDATLIKLCDRRHNHERSIQHCESYAAMYRSEYIYFKFALYTPGRFSSLWRELDAQYNKLCEM